MLTLPSAVKILLATEPVDMRRAGDAPEAAQQPEPAPTRESSSGNQRAPPAPATLERRAQCQPIPVPHAGGDDPHNQCADQFPPNRYPGMDVLVDGVRFDALQVGARILWEIKTHQFDTYPAFIRRRELEKEVEQLNKERDAAAACGYDFVVGVSTQAHKDALRALIPTLHVVVTGCTR